MHKRFQDCTTMQANVSCKWINVIQKQKFRNSKILCDPLIYSFVILSVEMLPTGPALRDVWMPKAKPTLR